MIAALFFCGLSVLELQQQQTLSAVMAGVAAVSAGVIATLSFRLRIDQRIVRLLLAYLLIVFLMASAQPVFVDQLLVALLAPFLFTLLLGFAEAFAWSVVTGLLCAVVLHFHLPERIGEFTAIQLGVMYSGALLLAVAFARMHHNLMLEASLERQRLEQELAEKHAIAIRNEKLLEDLNAALRDVRGLTGLISICSCCKKIRDDEEFWEDVEAYLHKRTSLQFTHGFCPACSDSANVELDRQVGGGMV